jgi:hypothetical protein
LVRCTLFVGIAIAAVDLFGLHRGGNVGPACCAAASLASLEFIKKTFVSDYFGIVSGASFFRSKALPEKRFCPSI